MASILFGLAGFALVVIALAADVTSLGSTPGFGLSQMVALSSGGALILSGIGLRFRPVNAWAKVFIRSNVGIALMGLLAGLFIVEAGLQVLDVVAPSRSPPGSQGLLQPVQDERLGLRLPPDVEGHDSMGFRNEAVPDRAEIVAIGDSQTWGINARRSEAWPQVLERLSNRTTYNMGLGFFSTSQYWAVTDEALSLSPDIIVIGLYLGNDIWGTYEMTYTFEVSLDTYARFKDPQLATDLSVDTVRQRVMALVDDRKQVVAQFQSGGLKRLNAWLGNKSSIVSQLQDQGLWFETAAEARAKAVRGWALANPERGAVYEVDEYFTTFTTAYRLLAIDTDEPRIAEGLRITKEPLRLTKGKLDGLGVRLLVLIIPNKESVFARVMEETNGPLNETYSRLVQMETKTRGELVTLFEEVGIEYADALPALSEAAGRSERIYPTSEDGHPLPEGYSLIASVVNDALSELGW